MKCGIISLGVRVLDWLLIPLELPVVMLVVKNLVKTKYRALKNSLREKTAVFHKSERIGGQKNIIFLLPDTRYPSGGIIVAHNHSDRINSLHYLNTESSVLYPEAPNFSPTLFEHQSRFSRNLKLDPRNDFVLISDVQVLRYAKALRSIGVKYGIHVQNGYLMDLEIRVGLGSYSELKEAYRNADILIGNSSDTVANISCVFPECEYNILRSSFVIDKSTLKNISQKKNIITYMPRKLSNHAKHVLFFLGDKLPANWVIESIDGVSEQAVYDIFRESKIFLSFSEFEGLAMPPAMAAMAGNRVIGYTGEGNKEYFNLPCFEEVPCGDIKLFVSKILDAVHRFDEGKEVLDLKSISELKNIFSVERQESFLRILIESVDKRLGQES